MISKISEVNYYIKTNKFKKIAIIAGKKSFSKINGKDKLIGLIILNNNFFKGKDIDLPDYLMTKYKFKIIGEWWFGSDMMGLMRSMLYNSKNKNNKSYLKYFDKYMSSKLNDLQKYLLLFLENKKTYIVIILYQI